MRNQKGFTLLELLTVIVIMAFVMLLVSLSALGEIDKARGSTLISEARMVYAAAQAVLLENEAAFGKIGDNDYTAGLSGTVNDVSLPAQTRLSQRMAALLAPDVVLSDNPATDTARASFTVKDGAILSMSYETIAGKRHFTVTIKNGETMVTHD